MTLTGMAAADRTYRIAEFAALAGVTTRALHHYDRLGLLRPKRSPAGYRIYSTSDLETLEEIVALKFVGVPLKEVASILRRPKSSFADVLRAQRQALEDERAILTQAIAAVSAAEALLQAGSAIDARLFRRIIEVMHMDTKFEETVARYGAMLKAKAAHIASMSKEERAAVHEQMQALFAEGKTLLGEDPAGAKAQGWLDRWLTVAQSATGIDGITAMQTEATSPPFRATPELRDALWARRAEWMPPGTATTEVPPAELEQMRDTMRERMKAFMDSDVLGFLQRVRAARA